MPYLAFDIETAVSERGLAYLDQKQYEPEAAYKDGAEPPTRITDLKTPELRAERLLEWEQQRKLKAEQSVMQQKQRDIRQAPLSWWLGKIICICAIDLQTNMQHCWMGDDEKTTLQNFFRVVMQYYPHHTLVGKHSAEFDRPYIVGRAMAHDIGLIKHVRTGSETTEVTDVNHFFSYSKTCQQITSLDNYAYGLGIEGKVGHGSQVGEMYTLAKAGDQTAWDRLAAYCYQDVAIVKEIIHRYQKQFRPDQIDLEGTF